MQGKGADSSMTAKKSGKKSPAKSPNAASKPPGKHPGGAPSKYDKQTCITAGWLARDGKTDKEIAEALGIAESTLHLWKKTYPEFSEALKNNKAVVDNKVVDSLIKRALGYDFKKTEVEVSEIAGKVYRKQKESTVHVPADPSALIFFLCNRQPEHWKRNPSFVNFDQMKGEINDLFNRMKEGDAGEPRAA